MRTHTDGPWSANLNGLARDKQDAPQWTVGKTCECLVILPNRSTPEETEANAHLIAAAPELLAALEKTLTDLCDFQESYPEMADQFDGTFATINAAIAKAKGNA